MRKRQCENAAVFLFLPLMIRKAGLIFVSILIILVASNFSMIRYGLMQLKGNCKIIFATVSIDEVLHDKLVPDSIKQKLLLIQHIKKFAVDSLGLMPTENYTSYFEQNGKPVLWVLTAAPPFKMESYEWNYPVLGKLAYKGFFEKESGIEEEKKLQLAGYDTDLSPTGGWSTLGWFKDPVLSNMLKKSEGALAELIIHELTHATLFVKGNIEFNENLATFIGEQGAEQFLQSHYPDDTAKIFSYRIRKQDEAVFGEYILQCIDTLQQLYTEFDTLQLTKMDMYKQKYQLIAHLLLGIENLPLTNKSRFRWNFTTLTLPTNPWFLSYSHYRKNQDNLQLELMQKNNGKISLLIASYKKHYGK